MNDLEHELAALPVAGPPARLDERVLSSLATAGASSWQRTRQLPSSLALGLAAACLLAGTLTGYTVATLSTPSANASEPGAQLTARADWSRNGMHPVSSERSVLLAAHLTDARFEQCQECHTRAAEDSERIRLLRQAARRNAADWEQTTGETFLVASHVADARFAACLRCHGTGALTEAM